MKNPKIGQVVIVYDRYRFAIPLRAEIVELAPRNDGVRLRMLESNSHTYEVGCDNVWVSRRQLRREVEV